MGSKVLLFCLPLAVFLMITFEVTARDLAETATTSFNSTKAEKANSGGDYGGGYPPGGGNGGDYGGGYPPGGRNGGDYGGGGNGGYGHGGEYGHRHSVYRRGSGSYGRGGGGYGRGGHGGGGCKYGCCGGHGYYGGCQRCCSYKGEKAVDAAKP